jgi:hypothetical protein
MSLLHTLVVGLAPGLLGCAHVGRTGAPAPKPPSAPEVLKGYVPPQHDPRPEWLGGDGAHFGTDYAVPETQSIIAIADGTVAFVVPPDPDDSLASGTLVQIHHHVGDRAYLVTYAHLADVQIAESQRIKRGQVLGQPWMPAKIAGRWRDWKRHVHVQLGFRDTGELDQLNLKCLSQASPAQMVYPVAC